MDTITSTITSMQLILMILGVATSLLIFVESKKSDKSWFKRNWIKLLLSLILSFVSVVLGPDTFKILGVDVPEGSNMPLAHAFLSGLLSDVLVFGVRRLLLKLRGTDTNAASV